MAPFIPIEISARHVHLSPGDLEALFGEGYQLARERALSQAGEFAAQERVDLDFRDVIHLDTDEGNALCETREVSAEIVRERHI
jgi:propanediol utilization protein